MKETARYKIIGDVYEVRDDGSYEQVPSHKVLSKTAYKHEHYLVIYRRRSSRRTVTKKRLYLLLGIALILVAAIVSIWSIAGGWFF